jgi:hypothetical protein
MRKIPLVPCLERLLSLNGQQMFIFLGLVMIGVLLADWNMLAVFFYPEQSGFERKELDIPGLAVIGIAAGLVC